MAVRIVSVFGATGTQGNAVIHALLKDGTFTPRAIVRNPDSEAALKLKRQGVEVVKGDGMDKEPLVGALRGSEAVLGVKGEGPNELTWGKNMVDAANEAGVKFFIWSSVPSVEKLSSGKYKNVIHYEQKAAVEEYLKSSGMANASFHLGGFLENYWKFGLLKKTDTGFDVAVPHFKVTDRQAFTWVEQAVPATVLALLKNYTDPSKNVSGKTHIHHGSNGGMAPIDEMVRFRLGDSKFANTGLYTATPVPNPDLVALGVKFGTIQEFLESKVQPRFGA
ncbi:hypothetical protein C8R45DRAFT_1056933 [Mycena sanguinolenta]|nr:hypothetical protein C8R45DRAFT_1056933 [Mycena sanguinolenta]